MLEAALTAEQSGSSLRSLLCLFLTMHLLGDGIGEHALCFVDIRALSAEPVHLVHGYEGEKAEAGLNIGICDIAEILIEIEYTGAFLGKPYRALLGLAHRRRW